MNVVQRVKNILLQPKEEWAAIDAEPTNVAALYTQYLVPLALAGTVARFISYALIGINIPFLGRYRVPVFSALSSCLIGFIAMLAGVYLWALIINALAPTFGGRKDFLSALKLAIYSATPALLGMILSILPLLFLVQLIAGIYGLYLLYIGFPVLMKVARDRAGAYMAATIVSGMVISLLFFTLAGALNLSPLGGRSRMASDADARKAGEGMLAGMIGAAAGGSAENKNAAAGLVAGMVAAGQQIEASEKAARANGTTPSDAAASGDVAQSGAAMNAAAAAIGSMVSGGKEHVEPVDFRVLEQMMPDVAGPAHRTNVSGQKSNVGGMSGSSAEGSYASNDGGSATVKISDMGNARGVLSLGKLAFSVESENDQGYEKNVSLGGQQVHEKWSTSGKSAELTTFVGDRFMVEVTSRGMDTGAVEKILASLDLKRLAASK